MWNPSRNASDTWLPEFPEGGTSPPPSFWVFQYPIFWATSGAVFGFLLGTYFRFPTGFAFALFGVVVVLEGIFLSSRAFPLLFFAAFWIFGILLGTVSLWLPREAFREWEGKRITLEGYVVPRGEQFLLARLSGFPVYSPAVVLRGENFNDVLFRRVTVSGTFRSFPSCVNPGGRDLRFHFFRRRIVGYLEVGNVHELPSRNPWFALLRWTKFQREKFLARWRGELGETFPLFGALFFGVKDEEFQKDVLHFQETGVYHLFCVSGFHIALLGTLLFSVFRRFLPRRLIVFVVLPFTFLYLAFCGFVASASRAWIMASLLLFGRWIGRTVNPLGTLLSAFFLMFLCEPQILFDPGAQLSFASTAGLVVLSSRWTPEAPHKAFFTRYVVRTVYATFCATLSSFPILVGNGFFFSSLVVLGNLLIVPLVEGVLFLALFTPLLGGFSGGRTLLGAGLRFMLEALRSTSRVLSASIPHVVVHFEEGRIALWGFLVWGLVVLVVLSRLSRKWGLVLFGIPLLLGGFVVEGCLFPEMRFLVFDVGQGLACGFFVRDSGILIDAGGIIRGYGNVGQSILLPALRFLGVKEIRGIFLTHEHGDHVKGVLPLRQAFPETPVFTPSHFSSSERLRIFPGVVLEVLPVPAQGDAALVFRLCTPYGRILIPGDAESVWEDVGWHSPSLLEAEVLLVPHHGSYHDTLEEFLQASRCRVAIISVGENPYGHPDPRTVALLERLGVPYYVTMDSGAVEYSCILGRGRVRTFGKRTL